MGHGRGWVQNGWIGVRVAECGPLHPSVKIYENFRDVKAADASVIAVDIPIGLLDKPVPGGRCADIAARRMLKSRGCCVFPAPSRRMVRYAVAREKFESGCGMNIQAWNICPKIHEVAALSSHDQSRIYECHPEVCFLKMRGEPMLQKKKNHEGRENRRNAL